jgi:hypothetical protein
VTFEKTSEAAPRIWLLADIAHVEHCCADASNVVFTNDTTAVFASAAVEVIWKAAANPEFDDDAAR